MKIIEENGQTVVTEAFNGITLVSPSGEKLFVCMRDSGFEFQYAGKWMYAKEGIIGHMINFGNEMNGDDEVQSNAGTI